MAKFRLLLASLAFVESVAEEDDSLRSNFKLIGQMTKFSLYGLGLVLLAMSPLRHQQRASLASFWLLWSFVQFARWLPTVDLQYPSYYTDFYQMVAQTMCAMQLEKPKGMEITQKTFGYYCASRNLFVVNGADMLLILLIALGILLVAMALGVDTVEGFRFNFRQQERYSALFRGVSITTLDLTIYAVLQVQFTDSSDNFQRFSFVMAVLYLVFLGVYTVGLPIIIVKNREKIEKGDPPTFCATLTDEFRGNMHHLAYHYETLLHAQRLCVAFTLSFLYSSPTAQLAIFSALEGIILAWMLWTRPFPGTLLLLCSVLVHSLNAALIALQWLMKMDLLSKKVISLASVFVLWSGILVCITRYFANFKLPQKSAVHLDTTNDTTDNSAILTSTPAIKSQHPNEPYGARVPRPAFLRPVANL